MISILIPIFNFNISGLVNELYRQAKAAGIEFEIILLDDASIDSFKEINSKLSELKNVRYIEEDDNLGRSKIRNKLADLASYPYLLYMDCDSKIPTPHYLKNYLNLCIGDNVICGGRIYESAKPASCDLLLRWKQGKSREEFSAEVRNKTPNKSFMTNNFVISKKLFNQIRFSEEIEGYGHEDTLFGYELTKNNISIVHIDNPLVHIGLETNTTFLEKTKESIRNLNSILSQNGYENLLVKTIKLLAYYKFFRSFRLDRFVYFLYGVLGKRMEKNLLGPNPNLMIFDFYKLGYLCEINQNHSSR